MASQQPTSQQLDRCLRIVDEKTGLVFYQVESESTDAEYEVRYSKKLKHLTCTCPAGLEGTPCKHRRWAKVHASEYREAQKLRNERESDARELALQAEYDLYQMECYEMLIQQHPRKPRDAAGVLRTAAQLRNLTMKQPDGSFW